MGRLLLFLLTMTTSVGAQGAPKPGELKLVAACLANPEKTDEFGGSCVGIVADPCIAAARKSGNAFLEAQKCATRELKVWTELMKTAIAESMKNGDGDVKAALVESQKTWSQSRERFCPLFDNFEPGSIPGGAEYCRLQETARRVLSLRRLSAAINPQ